MVSWKVTWVPSITEAMVRASVRARSRIEHGVPAARFADDETWTDVPAAVPPLRNVLIVGALALFRLVTNGAPRICSGRL